VITWQQALGWMLVPLALMVVVTWMAWVFGWGRFKSSVTTREHDSKLRFVAVDFISAIITEFRHLLALTIVLVFATTMILAMIPGVIYDNIDGMIEGLQAVAASLGGLLGSIIGYYFGESAASKAMESPAVSPTHVEQRGGPSEGGGGGGGEDGFVELGGGPPPASTDMRVAQTPSQLAEDRPS
jgi:hypothetical protein